MPYNNLNSPSDERIDQEAAEWFIKRDRGLSDDESMAYEAWLSADSRHKGRIQWHEQTWQRFSPIEEFDDMGGVETISNSSKAVTPPIWVKKYFRAVASVAAVFLVSLIVWGGINIANSRESVEFESRYVVSAYENRILADGSILELNKGARVKVRFTEASRSVWLHQGEAHFHVAKDPDRPFIVYAGTTQVRAVGTAFNVKRESELVQVVVTEGRINLSQSATVSINKKQAPLFSRAMDVGQVSTIKMDRDAELPVVETYSYDELTELLAWKPQTLEFTSTPLGDVVMAFNKRNDIQITLADDELETMPIEATFRSENVLAFARLLEVTFELQAERRSQNEIILSLPH